MSNFGLENKTIIQNSFVLLHGFLNLNLQQHLTIIYFFFQFVFS